MIGSGWIAQVTRLAAARAGGLLDAVEQDLNDMRGIAAERASDEVRVSGRGLTQRRLADPRLRFALRSGH